MGAWGTSLYANDAACDLRGDYLEKLKDGKSNQDATQELLTQYQESLTDPEEAPLVWFALADTQWDYGRLLPEVKEAALHSLQSTDERERWRESGEQQRIAWEKTLRKLEEKISSPQPPEKKIYKHRCYQCKWALGDTFAYRLTSDYSKAFGYEGKYIVFRKVSEDTWYPKHIIPVIQVYCWIGETVPALNELKEIPVLPSFEKPNVFLRNQSSSLEKNIKLICESEKSIPKDNLIFLGNLPGDDLIPFRGHEYWTGYGPVGWESSKYNHKLEHYVIDMYTAWNSHQELLVEQR